VRRWKIPRSIRFSGFFVFLWADGYALDSSLKGWLIMEIYRNGGCFLGCPEGNCAESDRQRCRLHKKALIFRPVSFSNEKKTASRRQKRTDVFVWGGYVVLWKKIV